MDPLTGVASIFAVISLAGQLANGALRIIPFLSRVCSSSERYARLSDLCMQLHNLANHTESLLQRCQDPGNSHVLASLSSAVQACNDRISQLENILRKVDNVKSRRLVVRTVAQIRLVSKTARVSEIERYLMLNIDMINFYLAIHSTSLIMCRNPGVALDHQQFNEHNQVIGDASQAIDVVQPQSVDPHLSHTSSCHSEPRVKRLAASLTAGPFNKWHDSSLDGQVSLAVEGQPLPGPVQLIVSKQDNNRIEYSLRAIPVLDENTEIKLRHIFFNKDLLQLRRILADGTVSVNSLNSRGESLLLFAQSCWDDEAALYLAELCNVTAQNVEVCASWSGSSEDAFRAMCWKADLSDSRVEDIFRDWEDVGSLPMRLEILLFRMTLCTSLDRSELFGSALLVEAGAWALAAHELGTKHLRGLELMSARRRLQSWENMMRWTIRQGARLHYTDIDGCSILASFIRHFHPLDAQQIIRDWLRFLASCDIDTMEYRIAETGLLKRWMPLQHWTLEFVRKKDISIQMDPSRPADVEVAWSVDPEGAASMVLAEFSGFGDDVGCYNATRYGAFEEDAWEHSWPFDYGEPSVSRRAFTMSRIHERADSSKCKSSKGKSRGQCSVLRGEVTSVP